MASIEGVSFNGLASGLDTKKIIEDLMTVDSIPLRRLESKKTEINTKSETFNTMKTNLVELQDKAFQLKSASTLGEASASSSDEEALTLKVSASAVTGNYSIKILSLAQAMSLSSNSYEETDTDLGLSGEILINGKNFKVRTTDSLIDIRNAINTLDVDVTASILKVSDNDNRLIVSSSKQGQKGFNIANAGGNDVLGSLGVTDGTKSIREVLNRSILSTNFKSSATTIGSLIGLSSDASGTVKIRNKNLSLDLSSDSLSSIRDKINDLNVSGVTATVESVEVDDETLLRLAITGTEDFTDDNNVLETLGILGGGTSGTKALFKTSTLYSSNGNGNDEVGKSTSLSKLGSSINGATETITISGTDIDGSEISKTIEIANNSKISDLLEGIEEAFSGNVTADIEDGMITVQSNIKGETSLDIDITANNENGGSLDLGTISTSVRGRDRLVVEGTDSKILINNIEVSRSTNEINDVLTGLTLNLKKADPDLVININVEQDIGAVSKKINDFVESYNKLVRFINEKSKYDREENVGGPLFGDMTTRTVANRIRNSLESKVNGSDYAFNQLAQIGVETTVDGVLKVNSNKLKEALNKDVESVIKLFTVSRSSSDDDISFVYSSTKSNPGTYNVTTTRAAEKAETESDSIEGKVNDQGNITIVDNLDSDLSIDYTEDMTLNDIANLINEEAQKNYSEIQESSVVLLQSDGVPSIPIDQNTVIGGILGVNATEGDTITITGANNQGKSITRIITLESGESHTIQDILDAIEDINENEISASIDPEGHILIQDNTTGTSQMSLSIETTVNGLDFGDFITTQKGRNRVSVSAAVTDDNRLKITHDSYGSSKTFTISGASELGIVDNEYAGIDVAGTINGVEGTGSGQTLTASNSDENSRGIVIIVSLTPEELLTEGEDQGTVTLLSGIADNLYNEINSIISPINGFIQVSIDSLKLEVESVQTRIEYTNHRLEQRRASYVRKFAYLERALSRLQSMQQRLSASLATLPKVGLI